MKPLRGILILSSVSLLLIGHFTPGSGQTPPGDQPPNSTALAHRTLGSKYYTQSDYPAALREYQVAYALDKVNPAYRRDMGLDLRKIGNSYLIMGQYTKAIAIYQQALRIAQQTRDTNGQSILLFNMGSAYRDSSQYDKALAYYQKTLAVDQIVRNRAGAATDLASLGDVSIDLQAYEKAIVYYQNALVLDQQTKHPSEQASALYQIGYAHLHLSQTHSAIRDFQQALTLFQQISDAEGQAMTLNKLGTAWDALSRFETALDNFQHAFTLYQQLKNSDGQAVTLNGLGNANFHLSHYDDARLDFEQSLTLFQQLKNIDGQAMALNNRGGTDNALSQFENAISDYHQAFTLYQQHNNTEGEASTLNGLGNAYIHLTQYDKAIRFYQQALPLYRSAKDTEGEAQTLNNLGETNNDQGQFDSAIADYHQALALYQQHNNIEGQAGTLNGLGSANFFLHRYDSAIHDFQQALRLYVQIPDIEGQAISLNNTGSVYDNLGRYDHAIHFYQMALSLYQRDQDRDGEAHTLANLMDMWQKERQASLAIFYGKQAVNVFQSIRKEIYVLGKDTQKIYLKDKEPTYRQLAELLIGQGRLPEAEQVLGLLKDQELKDFVQRDSTQLAPSERRILNDPAEQAQQDAYTTLGDAVTTLGAQIDAIRRKKPLTQADAKQLTQLQDQLQPAQAKFQAFLTDLPKELPEPTHDQPDPGQLLLDKSLQGPFQKILFDLGPGTVALYTIVEPDRYRVVMVTSQTQIARDYPIKSEELRQKILAFREVLQESDRDPRPLAQGLYKILLGPIEKDLEGAQATTLMWSLDDVLRYLPMAALYDGKQYLVEKYRNTEFTGASLSGLDAAPPTQYTVLGLGVSAAHPGYPALPGVPQELNGIVKNDQNTTGVMDGTVLLDGQLTWDALKTDLNLGYPIVHIASHFALGADYTHSFLLLGDGPHSLDELSSQSQIFQSADLLTLSACETGVGGTDGDGHEIESFGALAQEKGAQSIIASLWPVADASTPLLMDGFYRQLSQGSISKAEALRQAQIALLHGTVSASATDTKRAEIVPDNKNTPASTALAFTPDPKAPFAHPFYWASFILIGNWK